MRPLRERYPAHTQPCITMPIQTNAEDFKITKDADLCGPIVEAEEWTSTKYKNNDGTFRQNYTLVVEYAPGQFRKVVEGKEPVDRQLTRMNLTLAAVVERQVPLRLFRVLMKGEATKCHLNINRMDGQDGVLRRPGFGGAATTPIGAATAALDLEHNDDDGLPF